MPLMGSLRFMFLLALMDVKVGDSTGEGEKSPSDIKGKEEAAKIRVRH